MKTVINLVKELGVKSTAEVLELLRQVGVDTAAEGFGVMSKVDDATVTKLHQLQDGEVEEQPKASAAPKRRVIKDEKELNLSSSGLSKSVHVLQRDADVGNIVSLTAYAVYDAQRKR